MSSLFFEDTVAFRDDIHITGVIEQAWSDIDPEPSESLTNCYVHKDLTTKIHKAWFSEGRLLPGYVIVAFMQPYDGHCLISERALLLLDRSLGAGDVVKKAPSDAFSGTVISTSLMCSLQPLCSGKEYSMRHQRPIQGHYPSHGPHARKRKSQPELIYGFSQSDNKDPNGLIDSNSPSYLQVPANELVHWHSFREQDFVIYKNWVGQVKAVYDEVTVRLGDGSVVVVEDPDELEEPYYIAGTKSYELAQRLDRAGFYNHSLQHNSMIGRPQMHPADTYYPGQDIQTKKGNLRRGFWKYGAYDPSIPPRGVVVDVRCIQLEIKWIYPNQTVPSIEQASQPEDLLDTDKLNSGEVVVYNRSRVPKYASTNQLPQASYGPDTGFGHRVRFRDAAAAAIKYGDTDLEPEVPKSASHITDSLSRVGSQFFEPSETLTSHRFDRIPRTATQGFDMNVLQVNSSSTKATVRWQDGTHTVEQSTMLYPYLNIDEHDVWPGDTISFKPDEEDLQGRSPSAIRVHKAGIVQKVDATARIATIRWYEGAQIDIEVGEAATWQSSGLWYGKLGNEISEVPLYDVAAYPAINFNRGDGAIILPESQVTANQRFTSSVRSFFSTQSPEVNPEDMTWCGGIIDVCLDGEVIVRLGAAAEVRDIKLPPERILVVALEDDESDSDYTDEDDEENYSDEMSLEDIDSDHDTDERDLIDISVEYDGEKPEDADDGNVWTTDEEDDQGSDPSKPQIDPVVSVSSPQHLESHGGRSITFASYTSMPAQFGFLDGAPTDHHYFDAPLSLNASVVRRIMKENSILQVSLPDGVFVRAWESRLDLLRVLIVGPQGTPYGLAPFVIDFQLGPNFPMSPPHAFFHSWTGNLGRINPNLYEDGKICLSLLGTWDADEKHEAWSRNSTVLQIIVSLMGLVLVKEPYYNEAGFDVLIGSEDSRIPSQLYTEKVYVLSKAFIKAALATPPQGLENVIRWLYLKSQQGPCLLHRVVDESEALLPESSTQNAANDPGITKLSAGALILLRRNLVWLKDYLERHEA